MISNSSSHTLVSTNQPYFSIPLFIYVNRKIDNWRNWDHKSDLFNHTQFVQDNIDDFLRCYHQKIIMHRRCKVHVYYFWLSHFFFISSIVASNKTSVPEFVFRYRYGIVRNAYKNNNSRRKNSEKGNRITGSSHNGEMLTVDTEGSD